MTTLQRLNSQKATVTFALMLLAGCQVSLPGGAPKSSFRLELWERLNTGVTESLNDLHFLDARTGYVVGDKGVVLKTTDAGKTWQVFRPPAMADQKLERVSFATAAIGVAISKSDLFRTTDGGATWQSVFKSSDGVDKTNRSGSDQFLSLKFISQTNGWLGRDLSLFKTTDGGATWQKESAPESTGEFKTIATFGGNAWFADRNSLYRHVPSLGLVSVGGGVDHVPLTKQSEGGGLSFISEAEGWAVRSDLTEIRKTTDGGKSWQSIKPKAADGQKVGYGGSLPSYVPKVSVDFVNGERGWLAFNGNFYSTFDGGLSWYDQNSWRRSDGRIGARAIQMFSDANGYVVGGSGTVQKFSGQFDTEGQ